MQGNNEFLKQSLGNNNLRWRDERNKTPLHIAAEFRNKEALKFLTEFYDKTSLGQKDKENLTPLHYAAINNDVEAITILFKAGNDPEKGYEILTPLYYAVMLNNNSSVKKLLHFGAKFTKGPILDFALNYATKETIEILINHIKEDAEERKSFNKTNTLCKLDIRRYSYFLLNNTNLSPKDVDDIVEELFGLDLKLNISILEFKEELEKLQPLKIIPSCIFENNLEGADQNIRKLPQPEPETEGRFKEKKKALFKVFSKDLSLSLSDDETPFSDNKDQTNQSSSRIKVVRKSTAKQFNRGNGANVIRRFVFNQDAARPNVNQLNQFNQGYAINGIPKPIANPAVNPAANRLNPRFQNLRLKKSAANVAAAANEMPINKNVAKFK